MMALEQPMLRRGALLIALASPFSGVFAQSDSSTKSFQQTPGTGGSQVVRRAPPAVRPQIPEQPLSELHSSVKAARAAGGEAMPKELEDVNLAGLKQSDPSLKPLVVHTRNGVNTAVTLSAQLTNRIATPFAKPLLVGVPSDEGSIQILGSDIYYIPSGEVPVGVYVVNSANKNQVISLTIVPEKDIPGQNILLKVEDLAVAENLTGSAAAADRPPNTAADYTSYVQNIMTQAARGEIPSYTIVPLQNARAKIGGLQVIPDIVFTGPTMDVYRYRIKNTLSQRLDLSEPAFYKEGVKAVSFFPHLSLSPNEEGYVFILADKTMDGY